MAKKPSALSKLNNTAPIAPPISDVSEPIASDVLSPSKPVNIAKEKPRGFWFKRKKSALDKLNSQPVSDAEYLRPQQDAPYAQAIDADQEGNPSIDIVEPQQEPFANEQVASTDAPNSDADISNSEAIPEPAPSINYTEYEDQLNAEDMLRRRRERVSAARRAGFEKFGLIAMTVACVYLLFLIFGVVKTEYVYNEDGRLVAQRMTYKELVALESFEDIKSEYMQARRLYETILRLDYKIAAGVEDPLLIAPEYETTLEQVDKLVIQIKALEVKDAKYNQLRSMLEIWVGTDAAVYCQKMSAAISRNDATAAADALVLRNAMYNDFTIISENITVLGSEVHGADVEEIKEWSPEKYINDNSGGLGGAI